jgi:hypothetical protein
MKIVPLFCALWLATSVQAAGNEFFDSPVSVRWIFWSITLLPLAAGILRFIGARKHQKNLLSSIGSSLAAMVVVVILGFPFIELIVVSGFLDAISERGLVALCISLVAQIMVTGLFSRPLLGKR